MFVCLFVLKILYVTPHPPSRVVQLPLLCSTSVGQSVGLEQTAEGHGSGQRLTNQVTVLGLGLGLPQSPCLGLGTETVAYLTDSLGDLETSAPGSNQREASVISFAVGIASPELTASFMSSGDARGKCALMQSVGWGPRSCNWTSYCILSIPPQSNFPPKRWQRGAP